MTAPSYKDYVNPETHDLMEKYFGGSARTSTENRLRMVKLVRDLTSCYEDVLTIHAEGSLEAQKLSILQLADFPRYKAAAMRAAGIKGRRRTRCSPSSRSSRRLSRRFHGAPLRPRSVTDGV